MSVLARMLAVLEASPARDSRSADLVSACQTASPAGRAVRRGRRPKSSDDLSSEKLEQRQLLAVSAYYDPVTNGGYATIVAEAGDNAFLQKVATASGSLYVAGDSSFAPGRRTEIPNIDALDRIVIREGTPRADDGVLPSNYPMSSWSVTTFALSGVSGWLGREFSGTMSLTQPDGSRTSWTFTNAETIGNNTSFSNTIRLTSGIGTAGNAAGSPARPGFYYPTSVQIRNDGFTSWGRPEAMVVAWNVGQLPSDCNLTVDSVTWYQRTGDPANPEIYDNVRGYDSRYIYDTGLQPSATIDGLVFSLPNGAGPGLNDILLSTFRGSITLDNVTIPISTGGVDSSGLRFGGNEVQDSQGRYYGVWSKPGHYNRYISGSVNPTSRTVSIQVIGISQRFGRFPALYSGASDAPAAVRVDPGTATLSAIYAVGSSSDTPVTATVFAGHDITNAFDVQLTSPGSTFNVDSPVRVAANRSFGVRIAGTNVSFDAVVSTSNNMSILANGPTASLAQAPAGAVAKITNGLVTAIDIPPGWGGAGYDPDRPPTVTISAPMARGATARVPSLVNARVSSITVRTGGAGYTAAPRVNIDAPTFGGQTALATASLLNGSVDAIDVTNSGSGYTSPPIVRIQPNGAGAGATAEATIVGSIGQIMLDQTGIGYVPNSQVPVRIFSRSGTGAVATALTDANGSVSRIRVDNGGSGYLLSDIQIVIDPPPPSTGTTAEAVAVVDPATTRITRLEITNPGSGYGEIPTVTIANSIRGFAASGAKATVDAGGSVSGIAFVTGSGLSMNVNQTWVAGGGGLRQVSVARGGAGYTVGQVVNLAARRDGLPAQVQVLEVSGTGGVMRASIFNGGSGFVAGDVLDQVASLAQGYGYVTAPRVFIARPSSVDGIQAEAVATLDDEGRVADIVVTNPGSGYDPAKPPLVTIDDTTPFGKAETVAFNAGVGASSYDIELDDDRHTAVERSTLLVSNSGSIARDIFGNASTDRARIQVANGDIRVEGSIRADTQSYQMVSTPDRQAFMPYIFTTTAESGVQTGRIFGNNVAVTLANDADSPNGGSVAYNDVSIQTAINSLRVRAARRDGSDVRDPFPYRLAVDEQNDISIDAVAASSFPIELSAAGNMIFNSTLATAGGLDISKVNTFTVNTPVSTTKGQIVVSANNINISNSLRVLASDPNETTDDIVLSAEGGDINLNGGLVTAVNRVVMSQKNRKVGGQVQTGRPLWSSAQPIADLSTASMQVEFPTDFVLRDAQVSLDITHPFAADLSAALIAPDGTRVQLFNTGLAGANLTRTSFSSSATTPIRNGNAPYTGTFQPVGSLASLNGRRSRGIWTLEVRDNVNGDVGTLNSFGLQLTDASGVSTGRILGTSRIMSKALRIDAEGDVGNNTVLPGDSTYYLRTDVDTVDARVGGTFSLYDAGSVDVTALEAKGHVSLRADGVDAAIGANGRQTIPALRAAMTDVAEVDVSAPQGSIDVTMNTPASVIVGNPKHLALDASVRAGKVFAMEAAGDVRIRSIGGTTLSNVVLLDAPLAGTGGRRVRFGAATAVTSAAYDAGLPGFRPSTITATNAAPRTLDSILGVAEGTTRVGDRVLIAGGVQPAAGPLLTSANGVYVVKAAGSSWQLARALDADTGSELPSRSVVGIDDGPLAGRTYRLVWNGAASSFSGVPMTAINTAFTTDIGSDDARDTNIYVVSTTDGTNKSAGSLGKMILARQQNVAAAASQFKFSSGIASPIQLTQELPAIVKAFAINGAAANRYSLTAGTAVSSLPIYIDGTRIGTTSRNVAVTTATTVAGFRFAASSGGATQDVAASLSNVRLAGFRQGPAVAVDNAGYVSIDNVQLGLDAQGARLANRYGIDVSGAPMVTITNSKILGSAETGVRVRNGASGVTLVGNTIGQQLFDNKVGVSFESGGNRLGVLPVSGVQIKANTVVDNRTLTMPATLTLPASGTKIPAVNVPTANYLYVGQSISGGNIAPGSKIVAISGTTVTLSSPIRATGQDQITLGTPARNVVAYNQSGVILAAGANTVANSDVVNNTLNGITITGNTSTSTIGLTPRLGVGSNAIASNGGAGVSVEGGAQLKLNPIRFNYFGASASGATTAVNAGGNIRENGKVVVAAPYAPNAKDGLDANGNLHAVAGLTQQQQVVTTPTKVTFPWRPRAR